MKLFIVLATLYFFFNFCDAQGKEDFKGTVAFGELVGLNLAYSLNVEQHLKEVGNINLGIRFGLGGIPNEYGASAGLTGFCGSGRGHFDFGLATSYIYGAQSYQINQEPVVRSNALFLIPIAGYRYQRPEGGFFFKAGVTPLFRIYDFKSAFDNGRFSRVLPSAAICIGYYFKKRKMVSG